MHTDRQYRKYLGVQPQIEPGRRVYFRTAEPGIQELIISLLSGDLVYTKVKTQNGADGPGHFGILSTMMMLKKVQPPLAPASTETAGPHLVEEHTYEGAEGLDAEVEAAA